MAQQTRGNILDELNKTGTIELTEENLSTVWLSMFPPTPNLDVLLVIAGINESE